MDTSSTDDHPYLRFIFLLAFSGFAFAAGIGMIRKGSYWEGGHHAGQLITEQSDPDQFWLGVCLAFAVGLFALILNFYILIQYRRKQLKRNDQPKLGQ
jgi:hypothetical protein